MIKNEMNISLVTDATNIKGTAVFGLLENDAVLPYTIGYIPWDMMSNSGLFRLRSGLESAIPRDIYNYTPDTILNEPTRGIPFAYSYKSSWLVSEQFATLHDENGWKIPSNWTSQNALGLIHSYNTDALKSSSNSFGGTIYFGIFTALENDSGVVTAYYTDTTLNNYDYINGTFTKDVTAYLAQNTPSSVTFTINDEKLKDAVNGIVHEEFENISYYSNVGTLHVFWWIYQVGFSQNDSYCGGGVVLSENYRTNVGYRPYNFTAIQLDYGESKNDVITVGYNDDTVYKQYSSQYMQAFEELDDGGVLGRYAITRYTNILITHGITYDDLRILVCTASPYYYINGAYYVAEFTDDYYITGNLIPYSDAREWQKFINPDKNDFNPDDIPEPTPPEPGDDADSIGADITGFDFTLTPLSAANNFTTLYALTTGQLAAFGRTLWAKLWSADFWKSVGTTFLNDFSINPADMMRYFINLHYFPFDLSVYPWSSTDGVYVGRAVEPIAVETRVFSRNLIQIDGGVCYVPTRYNDFRDYEPCTNVEVTIPFCGNVQIAPSECVGKFLSLKYTVDMQTGAITALLSVQSDTTYIIAQLSGQCAATIPITADNNLEFVGRIAKVTGATLFEGIKSGAEMFKESESVKGSIGIGAAVGIASGAAAVTGLPPVSVHKMGDSGGFANYGGAYRAYITVTRQKYSVPTNYGHAVGYAADFTATVGSLSGLFACQNVDTSGLTCNYDERAEIKRLLESGCYM